MMTLVDKYIAKTVLASIILVLLMLTGLQGFILFVNQLGDLGKADYGIMQALVFIALGIPYQVYLFFPMASLLGCLIGLGIMANNHELVVMRAAGMSIGQITLAVFKVALILIVIMTLLGEMVLPKMVFWANDYKSQALSEGKLLETTQGLWLRDNKDIISITFVRSPTQLMDVEQFHFDDQNNMLFARHIEHVDLIKGEWMAYGVNQTSLGSNKVTTSGRTSMRWNIHLDPRLLRVSHNEADEMTFTELHHFLVAQKAAHQNVKNYQLAYWQRLMLPLTTVVMMLLAIPFVFGPLRSSTMGSKLILGAVIGFGFYILNRFCGSLSQIYQFSSIIAAIGPTAMCALLGLYLMHRSR